MSETTTLTNQATIEKINSIFINEFEVDASDISPDKNLKETLDLDSLDYVDLVVLIDDNFGFKPKGEDFTTIVTIQDFYNFVITNARK
ncbi:MAG: acyl carrier protein [Bacteroidia bacterium]|nr:acyl carrier protein [Bacteroidia bacterium]